MQSALKIVFSLTLLLFFNKIEAAQTKVDSLKFDCANLLSECLKNLDSINMPEQGKMHYFEIEYNVFFNDSLKYKTQHTNIKFEVSNNKYWYENEYISYLQDKDECITIIPIEKQIIRSKSPGKVSDSLVRKGLFMHRDSVVKDCQFLRCNTYFSSQLGVNVVSVDYKVKKGSKYIPSIQKLRFIINPKDNRLLTLECYYNSEQTIKKTLVNYKKMKFNLQRTYTNEPVFNEILESNGKLKSKFKGYKIQDVRNK